MWWKHDLLHLYFPFFRTWNKCYLEHKILHYNTKYCTKTVVSNTKCFAKSLVSNMKCLLKVLSQTQNISQKYLSQKYNMGKSIFENIPNGYSTQTCMAITQKKYISLCQFLCTQLFAVLHNKNIFSAFFFAVLKFFLNFHVTIKKLHLKFVYGQLHTKVAAWNRNKHLYIGCSCIFCAASSSGQPHF